MDTAVYEDDSMLVEEEIKHRREVSMYAPAVYQLTLAMGIGTVISFVLSKTGMTFPIYIGSMIVAAIMRNISEYTDKFRIHMGEINDLGSICLSLFLGVAMITLKLWQLAALALPLFILLAGQVVLMYIFARFIIFKFMGSSGNLWFRYGCHTECYGKYAGCNRKVFTFRKGIFTCADSWKYVCGFFKQFDYYIFYKLPRLIPIILPLYFKALLKGELFYC